MLDFAITLVFFSLLAPLVEGKPTALTAGSALIVAVLGADLPVDLGLLVAVFCGISWVYWPRLAYRGGCYDSRAGHERLADYCRCESPLRWASGIVSPRYTIGDLPQH